MQGRAREKAALPDAFQVAGEEHSEAHSECARANTSRQLGAFEPRSTPIVH
jgi:hypothetical protein